jgi:tetratricopeptide (TPR) repeat protein
MRTLLLILTLSVLPAQAKTAKAEKGLLPELKLEQDNEDANQEKAVQSEVLIAKSEAKAIAALNAVLKKKKGTAAEPDLWFRMAELYMRRAKSGRFFDLTRNTPNSPVRFAPPEVREESAISNLKQTISIYNKIEREFPNFGQMDEVLFNNAFANQQIGQKKAALTLYGRMTEKYPRSPMVPDAHLAMGEMAYEGGTFALALEHFRAIEKFPGSRVYSYGLYKQAWALYNLKQNEEGTQKLIQVVKFFDPENKSRPRASHNLRAEALRDLTLFFGEKNPADEAYSFFAKLCTAEELGDSMITLGKLYDSHSRQKEMNVFLNEYIKKNPDSAHRIRAELLMIQGNETIKNRSEVVAHMEDAAEVCRPKSAWRTAHPTTSEADCDYDLAKANIEIAKKWWELWLKNKQNKEIAQLTEKAFKIHLDREDPAKPDTKSHYAYAELLFQQEKFREASEQYEFVAQKSADTTIAHDAAYSAIVAMEKASGKTPNAADSTRLFTLCDFYLKKYPQGTQASQVRYKIGFLAYDAKKYEEAEKWLRPIAQDKKQEIGLRVRSQDLVLDILNARQDLDGIRDFAKSVLAQTEAVERRKSLQKIMQEADYNSIQRSIEKGDDKDTASHIQKLVTFSRENRESTKLAQDSLWQAMGLAFSKGRPLDGAEIAFEYARVYPQDERTTEALRNAAKHYNEQGFLMKAAATLELLTPRVKPAEQAKIFEAVSEIYSLENRKSDAREFLHKLLDGADRKEQGKIYSRLLATYKGEESGPEYAKLEAKILSLGLEPSASEIKLKQVQKLFDAKKYTDAFNQAKGLVGGDGPKDVRAKARLIQAKVLELEMIQQSTKTSIERLSLVLSMKTEKLDKAQTAYLTSMKMSEDANVQLAALEGLTRLYQNYVENVGNPTLKTDMKEDEKKALAEELAKLVKPIKEKQIEIEKKLTALSKAEKTATTASVDFAELPVSETIKPQIPEVGYEKLGFYLPRLTQPEGFFVDRDPVSGKLTCNTDDKELQKGLADLMSLANRCLTLKKYTAIEKIAVQMAQLDPKSGVAPYYLSLAASGLGQNEKALYLVELALKKNGEKSFFWYQKALALGQTGDRAGANRLMIKAFDERLDAWETRLIHGVVAYSQGDCFSVADDFKALPNGMNEQFQLLPVLSECMAQKGELDPAIALVEKALATNKSLALALQWGHLAEVYKMDSKMAVAAYEKAKTLATDTATQDWLKQKVKWLNNPNSVTANDSLHVESKVASQWAGGGQ